MEKLASIKAAAASAATPAVRPKATTFGIGIGKSAPGKRSKGRL